MKYKKLDRIRKGFLVEKAKFIEEPEIVTAVKEAKITSLSKLIITHNTVAYDANGGAIGNMAAVMGIANFKYNQGVAMGNLPEDVYNLVYKESKIWWKGADDKPHEVMIESVCEALEKSMLEVATLIGL